jgi:hypothetical protein
VPLVPLFRKNDATTVAFGRCGKGGLIVLGSAWSISNDGIASDDNLILLLNALNQRGPAGEITVTFDEYHHGYGRTPGIMSLIGTSARLGILQLCMAFLLLVFAVSRRFGKPIYLREGARYRSEYLSSMSSLLMKARALDVVRRELDRKFREDLCHWLGLPPDAGADSILSAAELKMPGKVSDMRTLIRGEHATDEKSVLVLQAKRDQLRRELMNLK